MEKHLNVFSVEFLTRPGCHLCEEAEPVVRSTARWAGVNIIVINIEDDPEAAVYWGLRIPVVRSPSGAVLAEGNISRPKLLVVLLKERVGAGFRS